MADFDPISDLEWEYQWENARQLKPGSDGSIDITNIIIPAIPILITIPVALCVLVPNLCFLNLLRPPQLDAVQQQPPQEQPPEQEPPPPPVRIPDPNENFEVFLANCGKNYADELEMDRRRGIFEKNVEIIREANRAFDAGQLSYELRVNCFGDLELEEFARENLGLGLLRGDGAVNEEASLRRVSSTNRRVASAIPYSVDWAERGAVTPVLDQSPCNSCAAHAATATIEACFWKQSGVLPAPLSQQQLVDCTAGLTVDSGTELERSNLGCQSGFPDVHLKFVKDQGGLIKTAEKYPLEPEREAGICLTNDYISNRLQVEQRLEDFEFEFFSDEDDLQEMVGAGGPTVTNVDVTVHWQFYGGGVYFNEAQCDSYNREEVPYECQRYKDYKPGYTCLGECKNKMPLHCNRFFVRSERFFPHSLIVVGYGTDGYGWDYWRMKNSWGTQWGEDGYIRLYRGLGHCGAGSYVSQAVCQSSTSGYL